MTLEERKALSLEILKHFKSVCEKNNIRYFLAYGTLLGCVRHAGFIPWDDDVDVWVPLNDFIKLMYILKDDKKYELLDFTKGEKWKGYFSKLSDRSTIVLTDNCTNQIKRGISLDIFPLYNFDPSNKKNKKIETKINSIKILSNYYNKQYKSIPKRLYCFFMSKFFWNYSKIIKSVCKLNNEIQSIYYSTYGSIYSERDIHSATSFSETILMKFQDDFFNVPIGYDQILNSIYGDYKKMPPISEQKTNHKVKAYYLDEK